MSHEPSVNMHYPWLGPAVLGRVRERACCTRPVRGWVPVHERDRPVRGRVVFAFGYLHMRVDRERYMLLCYELYLYFFEHICNPCCDIIMLN